MKKEGQNGKKEHIILLLQADPLGVGQPMNFYKTIFKAHTTDIQTSHIVVYKSRGINLLMRMFRLSKKVRF